MSDCPNVRIYDARALDVYQWDCARYLFGAQGAEALAERVSVNPLKDREFLTFLDQTPPFKPRHKWDFAFDKKPVGPNGRHRQ
jgi:hypothetical protein